MPERRKHPDLRQPQLIEGVAQHGHRAPPWPGRDSKTPVGSRQPISTHGVKCASNDGTLRPMKPTNPPSSAIPRRKSRSGPRKVRFDADPRPRRFPASSGRRESAPSRGGRHSSARTVHDRTAATMKKEPCGLNSHGIIERESLPQMASQSEPEMGINSWLEDELYQQYLHDRSAVDESWKHVFEKTNGRSAPAAPAPARPRPAPAPQPLAGEQLAAAARRGRHASPRTWRPASPFRSPLRSAPSPSR